MDQIAVVIWRDSVAAGDDVDAPHEWVMRLPAAATVATVVDGIIGGGYLASIVGGRATWTVDGRQPVAVIAQQWMKPRWLMDPALPVSDLRLKSGHAWFKVRYWCQEDPQRVYSRLRAATHSPDPRRR